MAKCYCFGDDNCNLGHIKADFGQLFQRCGQKEERAMNKGAEK